MDACAAMFPVSTAALTTCSFSNIAMFCVQSTAACGILSTFVHIFACEDQSLKVID